MLLLPRSVCKFCLFLKEKLGGEPMVTFEAMLRSSFQVLSCWMAQVPGSCFQEWRPDSSASDCWHTSPGVGQRAGRCEKCASPAQFTPLLVFSESWGPSCLGLCPHPAHFPQKKAKVSWDHTARWMPGSTFPGANYGSTLDKSQHMLWKALCITAWQFLTMCSCNSCQRQC